MNAENRRKGYTSVSLGGKLIKKIDKHGDDLGGVNRSMTMRMILERYYELKDRKVDILKMDTDEIVDLVMK